MSQKARTGLEQATAAATQGLSARYNALKAAESRVSAARKEMDSLLELADTVTQEDVVKGAGKLVAGGGSPVALASLLAEMPESGAALQGWVQQKDKGLRTMEALLEEQKSVARHKMGVAGLQQLMAGHIAAQQQAAAGPGNALAAGTSGDVPSAAGPAANSLASVTVPSGESVQ